MCGRSWFGQRLGAVTLVLAMFLSACGGGSEPEAATPQFAIQRLQAQAAAIRANAVPIATAATQLMDYAENSLGNWFPGHKTDNTYGPFLFRYYPETGVYLGVIVAPSGSYLEGDVYVVGPPFGSTLDNPLNVGPLTRYITPVDPGAGGSSSLVITAASNAARNATYAPVGNVFQNGSDSGFNAHTADNKFELEVVWAANATIKRAHIWFFDAGNTIRFFGCDGGKAIPCTGLSYDPVTQKITFTGVVWNQVEPDLGGNGPDTTVSGGEHLTINGTLEAK